MLYKIYQKQVEAWKERFLRKKMTSLPEETRLLNSVTVADDLLLSRHKDTIELIEAIIKEVEGMIGEEIPTEEHECHKWCCGSCWCDTKETLIKKSDLLTTLQAEKELIENEK